MTPDPTEPPAALSRSILALRLAALVLAVLAGAATLMAWTDPENAFPRISSFVLAGLTAVVAFFVWLLEERRKKRLEGDKKTISELLDAERIRTTTITNGAFLPTLAALQALSAQEINERRTNLSGFRQKVVERACDLVKNPEPRAAYFRVQDHSALSRIMSPEGYVAQRGRVDEFTTQFVESDGTEADVWQLIDTAEKALLREEVELPGKVYHSYISAPVRAGGIAFGMLTLNVLDAGGLSREDGDSILVLARLLGVAESLGLSPQQRGQYSSMSGRRRTLGDEGGTR